MAIQYTIELRKMLNARPGAGRRPRVPVPGLVGRPRDDRGQVRQQPDATKEMKRAAADLIWSASAKVSRAERAEVIRRLPPLLEDIA